MNFRADDDLKELVKEYAKKTRQTKSRFIREAILEKISEIIEEEENENND